MRKPVDRLDSRGRSSDRARLTLWAALAPAGMCLAGCISSSPTSLTSEDPQARTRAIVGVAERDDRSSIPDLIGLLASDDPAERMLAINTLKRMTGQTLGYEYADEFWKRDEAIARWVDWWKNQQAGTASNPSPGTSSAGAIGGNSR